MTARTQKSVAPFDRATMVPYPVRTVLATPDEEIEKKGRPLPKHAHHVMFQSDECYDDPLLRALRARQQWMLQAEHFRYHDLYEECAIPVSPEMRAALLIWLLGGYVADRCVHVDRKLRVEEEPLALAERRQLVESGLIHTDSQYQENVRRALYPFIAHSLHRSPAGGPISATLRDYNQPWYYTISSQLLPQACEVAMEPFAGDFAALYRQGELPLAQSGNIGEFVLGQIVQSSPDGILKNEVRRLRQHLEAVAA